MNHPLKDREIDPGNGFVFYRLPGKSIQFITGAVVVNPSDAAPGFYLAPFDAEGASPLIRIRCDERITCADSAIPGDFGLDCLTPAPNIKKPSKRDYLRCVRQAVYAIESGLLIKVVLSRCLTKDVEGLRPVNFFKELCAQYPDAFCYLFWSQPSGMWCGATPETLVRFEHAQWQTVALAGTLPVDSDADWSEKEYEEQMLVTKGILEKLQSAGYGVVIGKRRTIRAGQVRHLLSPIQVEGQGTAEIGLALARLLHPTPAVGGMPAAPALDFIRKEERRNRQYYTGYLGPVGMDAPADLFVNLRCCQLFEEQAVMHVGGGITTSSDPELEWAETVQKSQVLMSVLNRDGRP